MSEIPAGGRILGRRATLSLASGWAAFVAAIVVLWGVPFDRLQVLSLVVATLGVVTVVTAGRSRDLVLDWVPLSVLLVIYELTRGAVDTLGMPVQVGSVVAVEETVFGGDVPSVWLQDRMYRHPHWEIVWWEVPVALIYASHFIVPYAVGAWHWTQGRDAWRFWLRRFVGVTAAGLAMFTLLPAAPPWMASQLGVIGPVSRTAARGWSVLGLEVAEQLINTGQASVNLVAAFPSLHAGYAALVPAMFWQGRKRTVRLALLVYPLAMGVTLVLTGEHYVIDVLAGFALVVVVCWITGRRERSGGGYNRYSSQTTTGPR